MSELSVEVFKMAYFRQFCTCQEKIYLYQSVTQSLQTKVSKAVMQRTKLRNKFLKQKNNMLITKKESVSIFCKAKRLYFENPDINNLSNNRKFQCA